MLLVEHLQASEASRVYYNDISVHGREEEVMDLLCSRRPFKEGLMYTLHHRMFTISGLCSQSLSEDTSVLSQSGLLNPGKVVQADT